LFWHWSENGFKFLRQMVCTYNFHSLQHTLKGSPQHITWQRRTRNEPSILINWMLHS
jgi:hypothetical protein